MQKPTMWPRLMRLIIHFFNSGAVINDRLKTYSTHQSRMVLEEINYNNVASGNAQAFLVIS